MMKVLALLISLFLALEITAAGCLIAGALQNSDRATADIIGFSSLALGALFFVVFSVAGWRMAGRH